MQMSEYRTHRCGPERGYLAGSCDFTFYEHESEPMPGEERAWYYTAAKAEGHKSVRVSHCPLCGTRLNEDGSTTRMAPAAPPAAVRETQFWQELTSAFMDPNVGDALERLGLMTAAEPERDLLRVRGYTDQGRTIIAALAGSGAAAQWLAEQLEGRDDEPCVITDRSADCPEPGTLCENCPRYIADAAGWLTEAAKATGQTPAQPSDMVPRAAVEWLAGAFAYLLMDELHECRSLAAGGVCPVGVKHRCEGKCDQPCQAMFVSAALSATGQSPPMVPVVTSAATRTHPGR